MAARLINQSSQKSSWSLSVESLNFLFFRRSHLILILMNLFGIISKLILLGVPQLQTKPASKSKSPSRCAHFRWTKTKSAPSAKRKAWSTPLNVGYPSNWIIVGRRMNLKVRLQPISSNMTADGMLGMEFLRGCKITFCSKGGFIDCK